MNAKDNFSLKAQIIDRVRIYWRTVRYFRNFMLPNKALLEKTAALKGIHKGTSAFVFGCGPSINLLDKHKLNVLRREQGFKIYAVNAFLTSDTYEEILPDYYMLSDPASFGLMPEYKKTSDLVWKRIIQHQIPVFAPVDLHHHMVHKMKYVFCDQEDLYSHNVTDPFAPRGFVSLSVMKAIQIALFMGHEKIYVCGVDHDHSKSLYVNKDNKIVYDETHFYDGEQKTTTVTWNHGNMTEMFYGGYLGFESYSRFAKHPIINLNPLSFVDCFSKEHSLDVYKKI